MAQKKKEESKSKIFISHAWEDKSLVRRLEKELAAAGAEVWVDHNGVRGGDSLPKRISDALQWCNALVLVWSKAASSSYWVELEWANAVIHKKNIIPCCLDDTQLPLILSYIVYVDFSNKDHGLLQLLRALHLTAMQTTKAELVEDESVHGVPHGQLVETSSPPPTKPAAKRQKLTPQKKASPKPKPAPVSPGTLRTQPISKLSENDVMKMLMKKNFYDSEWNKKGDGIKHKYEFVKREKDRLIIDHTTGLIWQQSGSDETIVYDKAKQYIDNLNNKQFGGFVEWRLPTLEEVMSLMEPEKKFIYFDPKHKKVDLHIDPIFNGKQKRIWTADKPSARVTWAANFDKGSCRGFIYFKGGDDEGVYVRAVLSRQSLII